MWSPEEQRVIESPYWELLVTQAIDVVEYLNQHYSKTLGNEMFNYKITGGNYRYVNVHYGNKDLLLLGNESNNPYGNTNKVIRKYSEKTIDDLALLIISKLEEMKHEL